MGGRGVMNEASTTSNESQTYKAEDDQRAGLSHTSVMDLSPSDLHLNEKKKKKLLSAGRLLISRVDGRDISSQYKRRKPTVYHCKCAHSC